MLNFFLYTKKVFPQLPTMKTNHPESTVILDQQTTVKYIKLTKLMAKSIKTELPAK